MLHSENRILIVLAIALFVSIVCYYSHVSLIDFDFSADTHEKFPDVSRHSGRCEKFSDVYFKMICDIYCYFFLPKFSA